MNDICNFCTQEAILHKEDLNVEFCPNHRFYTAEQRGEKKNPRSQRDEYRDKKNPLKMETWSIEQ